MSRPGGGRVHQGRDGDRGHHHHQNGQCVIGLADREAVPRRNKQEIEQQPGDDCRHQRGRDASEQ
ncbi:Uncharacterised protein [Mycobacteroides abscessus subsp. massiliense]|nr:Uncharacterised protein [Mycobacteroides abscessus subsp. massiliense]